MSDRIIDTFLPVKIDREEVLHKKFRTVTEYDYHEVESGLTDRRELLNGRHAVAIVPYDPVRDLIVMIRQFRLGAQMGTGFGKTVEIPAGLIDAGEEPGDTASRELKEETGLIALTIKPMCKFLTSPGATDEVLHLFYAEVNSQLIAEEAGLGSESEQTFPFTVTLTEAMSAVDKNDIHNGIVMLGLMWFSRHRETLITSE